MTEAQFGASARPARGLIAHSGAQPRASEVYRRKALRRGYQAVFVTGGVEALLESPYRPSAYWVK